MTLEDILGKKIEATKACIEDETDNLALAVSDRQWEEVQKSAFHLEKLEYLLSHLSSIRLLIDKEKVEGGVNG